MDSLVLDEIVARYGDMLSDLDTIAYTVTLPDFGVLSIRDAVRRLGADLTLLQGPDELPRSTGSISLHQVGDGIVTLDWVNPGGDRMEMTERLAGQGFRHWYVSFDIEGNTSMYAHYGQAEGFLHHPEPDLMSFTEWADHLGPLSPYTDFLASGYDSEDAEARVDILAACLAVVELESGVRLDRALMDSPCSALPMPL
ncbi:hypothetical protein ABZ815_39240 [Nonomuraea sp. NPDC047529]|uniref:hypothetical protein n=1 Tax=Nonomuraea sp. NPDC047529 TaxID=3155623 RepID=UPI0033C5D8CB